MKDDFIYKEMMENDADGVDFVPIWFESKLTVPIVASYSKKQWEEQVSYPKTGRRYWRLNADGRKEYCDARATIEYALEEELSKEFCRKIIELAESFKEPGVKELVIEGAVDFLADKKMQRGCSNCLNDATCDLDAYKDHLYNLRDGTTDCFVAKRSEG